MEKIKKLYNSTFFEINTLLYKEKWELVTNTNNTPLVFGNDTIMCDNFSQWKYALAVDKWLVSQYRKNEFGSTLILQISRNCYETMETDLQKKSFSLKVVDDSLHRLHVYNIQKDMDIVFLSQINRPPYQIAICNYTQVDSLIKAQIAEKEEYERALREQRQSIKTGMQQADSLKNIEDYASAMRILEKINNQSFIERDELIREYRELKTKMNAIKKEWDNKRFNHYMQLYNNAFREGKYTMAKEYLLEAKQIDPNSPLVLTQLNEIEKIETMNIIRKDSVFDYAAYEYSTCHTIETEIFNKLKNYLLNFDAGDIKFTYTLHTDTLGKNLSYCQTDTFLLRTNAKSFSMADAKNAWSLFLDTLLTIQSIPAVKIDYLYVNAATIFHNHTSWKLSSEKVSYNPKKIKILPRHIPSSDKQDLQSYFRSGGSFSNGKYTIEKREVLHQGEMYQTLALKKLYSVGPEAMVYSMLFPGAGSLAATQGQKGWGVFSAYIVFAGAGLAGILVSNSMAKKGKVADHVIDIVRYSSYGTLAVGGIIHISDIFVALKRGLENKKKSQTLKTKLKENAIYIQEFPQQFEP